MSASTDDRALPMVGGPPGRASVEELRDAGLKATLARRRVLDVLSAHDHLSPEKVHHYAERSLPGLSLSTTYRTLDTLCAAGLIGFSQLQGVRSYHRAGHRGHMHLTCRRCGAELGVDADAAHELAAQIAARHGFAIETDHLVLLGTCARCAVIEGNRRT